ncbi:Domain of unknown function (DUF3819)/CCR4-Not complex component, Not1, putative [Angomonas deanei]|uniref:CCR4-Not complex component, Not1 n=1 Tax=Angomonas deanei TaxID=59799 RepID=A0A7G2CMC1_9TRYP|nr:Domain of unknown function (DUF3819)/CCR4-Not complex component, Not1, putative [Angomonas deanei]
MMQVDQPPPHLSSPPPSARPLQATAAPFDPSGQGFARPSPQPPAEVVPFQLGTREVVPRPPVLILPTNVRVVAGLEKLLGEATGKFRAELASLLDRMAVNICDSPLARRPASIAVITSYALIRKDMNYFTNPAETVRSAEAMVRSLTANLCFSSIKKLADMIDQTLTQDGLLSRYPQLPQQPDVIALLATLNEDLLLRRIESISATRAWESLAEQLQAIKERPRYPIMEQLRGLDPNLFPFQHISPPQLDVYADYYNTLPVLNVFNALLRSVEDAVSRVGAVKPGEAPVELSLATLESATDDARRTLFDRVQSAIGFIKPESVVHEASVAIQKLMHCAEVHIQTLEKCTPADAEKCKPVLNANQFLMSFYILILKHCAAANQPAVQEEVTRVYLKQDFKFGYPKVMVPLVCELIAVDAINLKMFDMQLAQSVSRHLKFAGDFIDSAFQQLKLVSRSNVSVTLSALTKLTSERRASRYSMQVPPSPPMTDTPALFQLVPPNVTTLQLPQSPEGRDEAFAKTTLTLVMEWVEKYQERTIRSMRFVQTLQENNMLDSKNLLQFLSIALRMCVEHYATVYLQLERTWEEKLPDHTLRATRPAGPVPYRVPFDTKLFTLCDAFAELVHVLLRCCGIRQDRGGNEAAAKNNKQAENTLLKRVLDMIRNVFHQHYETTVNKKIPAGAERLLGENAAFIPIFQQQPYVRVISNILISLDRESNGLRDSAEVTASVQDFLLSLAPAQYPAFAFGWLELVSHRITIRRSTDASQERFVKLLVCAFRFIELITPTHNSISANGVLFVKCVFKLVVMLLHDFALFLATHYFPLANAIPPHCAQLMNCVLSSFPSEMTLEPPFVEVKSDNPILQRKLSPETTASQQAEIKRIFTAAANSGFNVPELIDRYIRSNDEVIPEEVSQQVLRGVQNTDYRPQRVLLNAIVLHVAITHLSVMPDTTKIEEILPQSNAMRLFRYLCLHFDTQYRYLLLVSFTIHMRFHNIQTNYFSLLFGFLFLPDPSTPEKLQIFIQEQITRALVEKTVIHQPHPWGVMSTFVGLMRDSKFNFWEKSFVTAPHLDQMFAKLKKTIDTTRAKAS